MQKKRQRLFFLVTDQQIFICSQSVIRQFQGPMQTIWNVQRYVSNCWNSGWNFVCLFHWDEDII